jgi:hypothetical protein
LQPGSARRRAHDGGRAAIRRVGSVCWRNMADYPPAAIRAITSIEGLAARLMSSPRLTHDAAARSAERGSGCRDGNRRPQEPAIRSRHLFGRGTRGAC